MLDQTTFFDGFGLMMECEDQELNGDKLRDIDEALIEYLNKFGVVDIVGIAAAAKIPVEMAIASLKGIIYQLPDDFLDEAEYDLTKGWVLSPVYFNGNIREKLRVAAEAEQRFPGKFTGNVNALKKILPDKVDFEEIRINIGACWIPTDEYVTFIGDFLNIKEGIGIEFPKDFSKLKITAPESAKSSVLNTITYGVRENGEESRWYMPKQYLTAIDIITASIIGKDVKVYDYVMKSSGGHYGYEYEPVLNVDKTIEAQDKQQQINDAFVAWVKSNKGRCERFERYYNDDLVGYRYSSYDGSFLKFADMNPDITLFDYQKDIVARILLDYNNLLIAQPVGSGKTYEMICACHELKRHNLSKKTLFVVPNNILRDVENAHRLLYKDDNILVIYPKDFVPKKRDEVLQKIRDNDYVAIYMAYSSFDMIVMSKDYYIEKMENEISELKAARFNAVTKYEYKQLSKHIKMCQKKLSKYVVEERECPWLTFDQLGVTTLIVDEAHNYKNIPVKSRTSNIVGMNATGSKKAREMLEKAGFVDRVIFATGTPITNSMTDLFTMQTYLQPGVLKFHKLDSFDVWLNTYGEKETNVECDVDSNSQNLRTVTRFTSFHNMSELMPMFSQVCDFHHGNGENVVLPCYRGPIDITVPRTEEQQKYFLELSVRTERVRNREVKRNEDNLLKITVDGRKAALHIGLTDYKGPINYSARTKIDACADKVFELYGKYPDTAQVVFCDIGTPKSGFNVYDCLKQKLIALGIPEREVAFVHDATTDSARSKLFENMNKGKLRVVIGSTEKIGVGVNVQERLVALHHLSVPWRPSDMQQREGRILRMGNTCQEVFVFRYITEGSFDAYSWQLLENKQKFISSFLNGTATERDVDDVSDVVLSYAEAKALAVGNMLIKTRVETAIGLERVKIAFRARHKELQELRAVINETPAMIKEHETLYSVICMDYQNYLVEKTTIPKDERIAFGEELLDALKDNVGMDEERCFDIYQGFSIVLPKQMTKEAPYILIKSEKGSYYCEMAFDKTPLGCSKSIDYILDHLNDRADKVTKRIADLNKRLDEAKADFDQGNTLASEIERMKLRLMEIDKQLEEQVAQSKKVS